MDRTPYHDGVCSHGQVVQGGGVQVRMTTRHGFLGFNYYRISVPSILVPCYPVATPIAFITSITPPTLFSSLEFFVKPMSSHCPVLRTTARQEKGPSARFFAAQAELF